MSSLGFATLTLATWLSFLQQPLEELPKLAMLEPQMLVVMDPKLMVIDQAVSLLGSPYRLGGSDPKVGIDCSHFVRKAYAAIGIELPQSAAMQIHVGSEIDKDEIQPGDLVFFKNTYKKGISHVGIALGADRFVHAASRKHGVIISSLDDSYFKVRYAGARRVSVAEKIAAQ